MVEEEAFSFDELDESAAASEPIVSIPTMETLVSEGHFHLFRIYVHFLPMRTRRRSCRAARLVEKYPDRGALRGIGARHMEHVAHPICRARGLPGC